MSGPIETPARAPRRRSAPPRVVHGDVDYSKPRSKEEMLRGSSLGETQPELADAEVNLQEAAIAYSEAQNDLLNRIEASFTERRAKETRVALPRAALAYAAAVCRAFAGHRFSEAADALDELVADYADD